MYKKFDRDFEKLRFQVEALNLELENQEKSVTQLTEFHDKHLGA